MKCVFATDGEAAIVSPSYLQQCNPNEDASHHRQVVLKPLLKLRDTAFNVDEGALLSVLVKNTDRRQHRPHMNRDKANITTRP